MGDVASVLWPLVSFAAVAGGVKCVALWLDLRAKERLASMERDEREAGVVAQLSKKVEILEMALKTWIANNPRR